MRLNEISPVPGSNKKSKRICRGIGSGKGKTGGRGTKGQKSRTGVSINAFEGGQMPIHRRLPKRGFNPLNSTEYKVVNLGDINLFVEEGIIKAEDLVDHDLLVKLGLIKKANELVKLLGDGELKFPLKFKLNAYSQAALSAITSAGGEAITN
ncbi:MAG: 50S ribosomal protein L15 [Sphingobacteriia bacterium]|nr:50S ribosomal protein L15 [Sphingobacteriia bacterium]